MAENHPRSAHAPGAYATGINPASPDAAINPYFFHAIQGPQQFKMLGDTDHSDLGIPAFVARDDTMAALQSAGVRHLFIERPVGLDHYARDLANGTITRQQFVDGMAKDFMPIFQRTPADILQLNETTADMILNAKQHGIDVHFADSDTSIAFPLSPERVRLNNDFTKAFQQQITKDKNYASLNPQAQTEYRRKFAEQYVANLPPEQVARDQHIEIQERLLVDQQIAANMKKIAGNDRSAIFYGWQHGPGFADGFAPGQMSQTALMGNTPVPPGDYPPGAPWNSYQVYEHPGASAPAAASTPATTPAAPSQASAPPAAQTLPPAAMPPPVRPTTPVAPRP